MPDSQMDTQYIYTAGQNNGRITQSIDNVAGQTVNYTYDALNRLTAAAATGGQWGQAYTYDGFGNLTSKTVTAGSGSNWSNASDPGSNRLIGQSYDANGNAQFNGTSYDVENRLTARMMTQSGRYQNYPYTAYQYDPMGHRVGMLMWDSVNAASRNWTFYFYDITGRVGAAVTPGYCGYYYTYPFCPTAQLDAYFAGRQVLFGNPWGQELLTDRLGSVRGVEGASPPEPVNYLPYGELQPNAPSDPAYDGGFLFATYLRDSTPDNQDYANQRYYNPWMGRFNSPDPSTGSSAADPASWNKYAYTRGDPVNRYDPTGMVDCTAWEGDPSTNGTPCGFDSGIPDWCANLLSGNTFFDDGDPLAMITCQEAVNIAQTPSTVAVSTCEETETTYVYNYLNKESYPLAFDASLIVTYSDTKGVDDRFVVALAGAESSYGKSQQASPTWGFYNAFSNAAHCQALSRKSDCYKIDPYSSYDDAITDAIDLLTGSQYFGKNLVTVGAIYRKYNRVPSADFLTTIYQQLVPTATVNSKVNFSRCP